MAGIFISEMPPRFLLQNFRIRSAIFTFPGLEVVNLVDRYILDFSLMLHANSPTRPTLISQGVSVSLTLTQRGSCGKIFQAAHVAIPPTIREI